MRPRLILAAALAAIVLGGVMLVPAAYARFKGDPPAVLGLTGSTASPSPSRTLGPPPSPPPPTLKARSVTVRVNGFLSWALLDRKTGKIAGSSNIRATNSTESMIKVWLASDYLRRTAAAGRQPTATRLTQASRAIRLSDDNAAESLFNAGGRSPVIDRLIKICRLTDTSKVVPAGDDTVWWSYTRMSPRDAVRMGQCVADGRAAGPRWTRWILAEMTKVWGTTAAKDQHATWGGGHWGIVDGLPANLKAGLSIKNGWTLINADGLWHLDCLAVHKDWVLSVMTRYPGRYGLAYGANVCKSVAHQLVYQPPAGQG
ncbi:MAG TPA: hypothetical protein VGJ63_15520 [Micromonosporaceae bacterium]|jgi:hypothetical protein